MGVISHHGSEGNTTSPIDVEPRLPVCFSSVPPQFVKKLSDISTIIGKEVQLQATVEGAEPISVAWFKDKGEIVRESDNIWISYSENIATLQFSRAEPANAGKYTCQIRNDAGMQECHATLSVLGESIGCPREHRACMQVCGCLSCFFILFYFKLCCDIQLFQSLQQLWKSQNPLRSLQETPVPWSVQCPERLNSVPSGSRMERNSQVTANTR